MVHPGATLGGSPVPADTAVADPLAVLGLGVDRLVVAPPAAPVPAQLAALTAFARRVGPR